MTGSCHVLSPEGEWVDFEAFDPGAVDAVKALLTCNNERDSISPTNEVVPAQCDLPGTVASTCKEVADDG